MILRNGQDINISISVKIGSDHEVGAIRTGREVGVDAGGHSLSVLFNHVGSSERFRQFGARGFFHC